MKIKRLHILGAAYILFYCALFFSDLVIDIAIVSKVLKYTSYLFFAICCFEKKYKKKEFIISVLSILFSLLLALFTKDFYFAILFLIIICSKFSKENDRFIFNLSFYSLLLLATITVILALLGILDIVNTPTDSYPERLGMGFYHSNVLPLIILYLLSYRFYIKSGNIGLTEIIIWLIIIIATFGICKSRNSLVLSIIIIAMCIIKQHKKSQNYFNAAFKIKPFQFFCKNSILILSAGSLLLTLIAGTGIKIVYSINRFFSGRFALAYLKMRMVGLHFINLMDGTKFDEVGYTLDNGYLYTILRYGIIFILLYVFVQKSFVDKMKKNNFMIFEFTIITVANFIDNDLYSYGFLPFIIVSAANFKLFNTNQIPNALKIKRGEV